MKTPSIIFLIIILSTIMNAQTEQTLTDQFEKRSFSYDTTSINYRFFIPENLTDQVKYPLVLTLHGSGERGSDNEIQIAVHGLATTWADSATQMKYKCFVVSPQCPENNRWVDAEWKNSSVEQDTIKISNELETVIHLIDSLVLQYPIDTDRIYLTGLSMGGFGTWDLITRFPHKFAAAIPMSGAGDPTRAELIKHIPLWVFHGDLDTAVPVDGSRKMVEALQACSGDVIYTELPNMGHVIWKENYENPLLIDWLFSKIRK
ncbi:MAG: phospholipase [Ignavibacteriae bacterium HGW-Ignavibacteriae-2]|jgi:predicted peptidase|nr:MAG: phospholipase [Ignavibacteriae bacterium HGW-Ignavibacteriae-2]